MTAVFLNSCYVLGVAASLAFPLYFYYTITLGSFQVISAKSCSSATQHVILLSGTTVLQGVLASIFLWMEVMLMKKNFDFKDLMSFGMFLLALLTFIHSMCQ